jgi:KDO2-lipid IV(A) lauroyltransferase
MSADATTLARIARLPLPMRRAAVVGAVRAGLVLGRLQTFGAAPLLMSCLRLPQREALRLDRDMVVHDWLASMEWLALLSRSAPQLRRDIARVRVDDEDMLIRLAERGKPILFAPLHMGCYAFGFARIMERYFKGRRMLILRARDDREIETRVMQRVSETGCDMRFLKVADKRDYAKAIRFARAGAVIVSFVDLPASYGGPTDVELLGHPATIGMGVDSLARTCGATVVPVSVSSGIGGDTVHVGRPFEVVESGLHEQQRVARIVRRHIETSVAAHPAEWHMWTRFHEFLRVEPLARTEPARGAEADLPLVTEAAE